MITYLVTVKQEIVHTLTSTIEVDALDENMAKHKAAEMLEQGRVAWVEPIKAANIVSKEPFIHDVEPLVDLDA